MSPRPAFLALLVCAVRALAAEDEVVWHGIHPGPGTPPELVYPFDGRAPKIAVQLHNHHDTTSPAVVATVRVNGRPLDPASEVSAAGPIVIPAFDYGLPSISSAGVYDGTFGPPPAVGETRTHRFEFTLALAPGATSPYPNQPATVTHVEEIRFTNLGETPALTGARTFVGTVRVAAPTAANVRAEVATLHSPWFPVPLAAAGANAFTFSQALPQRNDWHLRVSADGCETRVVPFGNYFDPAVPIEVVLAAAVSPEIEYERRTVIPTATGFWRAAVAEGEGTFVVFPGQERWKAASTDAESRALRMAGRIAKYRFDGTRAWEHAPGWETWGGDMTSDGRYVAYVLQPAVRSFHAPAENKLVLLDGATGRPIWSKSAPPGDVAVGRRLESVEVVFSPDARWLAVGSLRGQVTLVDRATGDFGWSVPATGPGFGEIQRLRFSPDGEFVYSGGGDGMLRKLRVSDGAVVWQSFIFGAPHLNGLNVTADGAWVIVGTKSGDAVVVRASDGGTPWHTETQAADAVLAPDGRHAATSGGHIFRTGEGSIVGMSKMSGLVRFTPDGRHFVQLGRDFRLHDLAGRVLRTFEASGIGANAGEEPRWAHLTRDGRYAIVIARDMLNPPQTGIVIYERRAAGGAVVAPAIQAQPLAQEVTLGAAVTLSVTASGSAPLAYRWRRNGVDVAGGESGTLAIPRASAADAGAYSVIVSNGAGAVTSSPADVGVISPDTANPARIANLSVRAGVGAAPLIVGFAVGGRATSGAKTLLVRGVGPALANFGVGNALRDPQIALFSGANSVLANDNWNGSAEVGALAAQVGAFPLADGNSRDAAMAVTSVGGSFTVHVASSDGASGTVLAEIYDGSSVFSGVTPRLVNVSARGDIGGGNVLIAGFVVGGPAARTMLIRGVGPTLTQFGVPGALADPQLTLFRGGASVAVNDNWYDAPNALAMTTAAREVGAFALNAASRDAAILLSLPPGSYTAQVGGPASAAGAALVEVYEVP